MDHDELMRLRDVLNGVDPRDRSVEDGDRRTEGGLRLPTGACLKRLRSCLGCGVKYEGYYPGLCLICKGDASASPEDEYSASGMVV